MLAGGSFVAQLLPILTTPVVTRIYSDHDLGVLGLFASFLAFSVGAVALGYPQAIVTAETDGDAAALLSLSFFVALPASLLASLLLYVMKRQDWLGYGGFPTGGIVAMVFALVVTSAYFALRYQLVRIDEYGSISRATVAQSSGRVIVQVLTGLVRASWHGLVLAELIGRTLGLRRMWSQVHQNVRGPLLTFDSKTFVRVGRLYRKFPLYSMPATILDSLGPALHVPLISSVFGLSAAGQYTIANQVILVPAALIGASVADVFHSRIARISRETPERALRFFYTVAAGLIVVGLVPTIVLLMFGESLFGLVLGEEWRVGGSLAAVMAPRLLSQLVVSPLSRVVLVYQGQELKLVYNAITVTAVVVVYWLARESEWNLVDTLARYTLVQLCLHALYFMLLTSIVRRNSKA